MYKLPIIAHVQSTFVKYIERQKHYEIGYVTFSLSAYYSFQF